MATRRVTENVERTRVLKLSWKQIERKRCTYPHEPFTVYALMQSDDKMLGYVINQPIRDKDYWCCYTGDQQFATTANLAISDTLKKAQEKLINLFADD